MIDPVLDHDEPYLRRIGERLRRREDDDRAHDTRVLDRIGQFRGLARAIRTDQGRNSGQSARRPTSAASNPNPTPLGSSVTLTATISPYATGGTVEFRDGSQLLASVALHQAQPLPEVWLDFLEEEQSAPPGRVAKLSIAYFPNLRGGAPTGFPKTGSGNPVAKATAGSGWIQLIRRKEATCVSDQTALLLR